MSKSENFLNQKGSPRYRLGEAGLAPVILLILLVGGLAVGLYAFRNASTIFKPKAFSNSVEILDGDCVKITNGQKVLDCERFKFKIRSPLEEGT